MSLRPPALRHVEYRRQDNAIVVRYLKAKILDKVEIVEAGKELTRLLEEGCVPVDGGCTRIVINCVNVGFFASEMFGELIKLEKKGRLTRPTQVDLILCNIKPEIYEVFAITRLNKLFIILGEEEEALTDFQVQPSC